MPDRTLRPLAPVLCREVTLDRLPIFLEQLVKLASSIQHAGLSEAVPAEMGSIVDCNASSISNRAAGAFRIALFQPAARYVQMRLRSQTTSLALEVRILK